MAFEVNEQPAYERGSQKRGIYGVLGKNLDVD